ncbi:UvrABC system protein C [bacterium HR30]|nr:UvrABC system protein C [bacterium HR30]
MLAAGALLHCVGTTATQGAWCGDGGEVRKQTLTIAEHAPLFAVVPLQPGVYVFRDTTGAPLYVGKSKNLRRRLQSYFATRATERRKAKMVQLFAETVSIELTGSDFAAMLRELELVQHLHPRFNRRMRHPERYAYLRVDFHAPFPRITLTTQLDDQGVFLGPFAARQRMRTALEEICDAFGLRTCTDPLPSAEQGRSCWRYHVRTCLAPCVGNATPGAYGRAVLQAVRTLTGSREALRQWQQRRTQLAESLEFERAGRLLDRELRVRAAQRLLALAVHRGDDALVLQPAVEPEHAVLWAIRDGDVARTVEVPRLALARAFRELWAAFSPARQTVLFVGQGDLDRRWIIHRWLRSAEGRAWSIPVRGRPMAAVWEDLRTHAASLPAALPLGAPSESK